MSRKCSSFLDTGETVGTQVINVFSTNANVGMAESGAEAEVNWINRINSLR
jgi:hypothetical protein